MGRMGYFRAMAAGGRKAWGYAALEVSVVASISLLPLLLAALRDVLPRNSDLTIGEAFGTAFLGGQLVFYAVGLTATIIWHSNKDFGSFLPFRSVFNLYCIGAFAVCSLIIGYDPTLNRIDDELLAKLSCWLFGTALFAYLLMAVIVQVHVNVGKSLAKDDNSLKAELRRSRGI